MPHTGQGSYDNPGDVLAESTQQLGQLNPITALIQYLGQLFGSGQQQGPQWAKGGAPGEPGPNPISGVQSGGALKGAMVGGTQGTLVDPRLQDQGLQQWLRQHGF